VVIAVLSPQLCGAQTVEPNRWFLRSDPYLWTANVSGTATIGDVTVPVDRGGGPLSQVSFLGNLFVEVGRNRWSGSFEFGSVSFDDSTAVGGAAPTGTNLDYSYGIFLARLFVVYRLTALDTPQGVSVLAGVRYTSHDLEVRSYSGAPDDEPAFSERWWDPTVGVRYHRPLPANLLVTVSADIGGFGVGSDLAWSATGVLGWRFSRPVGVTLGYRYMWVDYTKPGSAPSESFTYKGNQHGLMLGVLLVL
jgi:hypothetical protein